MSKLVKCATCNNDISSSAKSCPNCGQKLKSGFIMKTIKLFGFMLVAVVVAGLIFGDPDKPQQYASSSDEVSVDESELAVNLRPEQQVAFIQSVETGRAAADLADNDMQKGAAFAQRSAAMCDLLPADNKVADWVGTIYSISANNDGKGVLVVTVSDGVWASTWNNAFSDIGSNTLIEPTSSLFSDISALASGTRIQFSGEFFRDRESCISMQNLGLNGKIDRPEFTFRFSSVQKIE